MSAQTQLVSTQAPTWVSPPLPEIIAKSKNDLAVLVGERNPEREKVHAVVCREIDKMQALCLEAVKQHFSIKEALIHQENESKTARAAHEALRQSLEQRVAILKGFLAKDSKELEQVIATYKALEVRKAVPQQSNSALASLSNTCCGGISNCGLRETILGKHHVSNYATPCRHTTY